MSQTVAPNYINSEPSLVKHQMYSKYAKGEISRQELAAGIAGIQPSAGKASFQYKVVVAVILFVAAFFIPPSAKRTN